MKTNIRDLNVTKKQLSIIIIKMEENLPGFDYSTKFLKLMRLKKDELLKRVERILKSHKKFTRRMKIIFSNELLLGLVKK